MNSRQLKQSRKRLDNFLDGLLQHLGRSERRNAASAYVLGLLSEVERKTASSISRRFGYTDSQSLQQMLHSSPWNHQPVMHAISHRAISEMDAVKAWIIDDTGFPKKGNDSVGVSFQYSGTLGRKGNCQVAVSLNYATEQCSFPMDWRLFIPKIWTEDTVRRRKAGIPDELTFQRKLDLALEMIDRTIESGFPPGVIVADAAYGTSTDFRNALSERNLLYALGIRGDVSFWQEKMTRSKKPYQGTGKHPAPRYDPSRPPKPASQIAKELPEEAWEILDYWDGVKGSISAPFVIMRVQPSHSHARNAAEQSMVWLVIQRTGKPHKPYRYYLSNLPGNTSKSVLLRTIKLRWRIEMDYQMLKSEIGLDHYEGRSWRGWYHHVTLATMAYVFLMLERLKGIFPPSANSYCAKDDPASDPG